ncbi:MAG: hypothetical protein EOM50_08120 [Erysipelotrichia bacterium]|nr:hypothetical protein [Erysipelotrichia bacterium]NCC55261.1 hypothetical protein [Erysipelotrichia bacterium]
MRRLTMIIMMSFLMLVAGCANASNNKKEGNKQSEKNVCDVDCNDTKADMSEYETMQSEDHVFIEISFAKANELLEDKAFTGIIYYGYPACPWCVEAVPLMNEVAKKHDLNIYYVNKKSQDSIDHPKEEEKAVAILDAAYGLDKDEESGKPHLYVPEVIVVKKGKIIAHNLGTINGHNAKEREMNDDEKRVLKTIYENMFIEICE